MICDTCGTDSDKNSSVQWVDTHTARCSSCIETRTRVEAETVAAIVAMVERLTVIEVKACEGHASTIKEFFPKDRIPLHRMHEVAGRQSRSLGNIIKAAIERNEWRKGGV